jgi:hypothetical protein
MGADPKAEFLAQIARRKELIETSKKIIEDSKTLVEQSHRLIRIAMGHDVDEEIVRTRRNKFEQVGDVTLE